MRMLAKALTPAIARGAGAVLSVLLTAASLAAQAPEANVRRIIDGPQFKIATAFLEKDHDRFVRELITLTEVPAPPFKEKQRAEAVLALLREHAVSDVEMDGAGNVMGVWKGAGSGGEGRPMVAVLAHIDTV
ncbi:MAG: hypothetical protein H0W18_01540, partial [Acidobacteria bacterium]|nr:hypothetical protein [Acidobacteriota bacterium]